MKLVHYMIFIRIFAPEKSQLHLPMTYIPPRILNRLTCSSLSTVKSEIKQSQTNQASERKNTRMSFIFHLLFLYSILILSACSSRGDYDFKDSSDALNKYRDFHHSLCSIGDCSADLLAESICHWQELSDTVFNFIRKDPAFTAHAFLSMTYQETNDSIRMELIRLADDCTLKDVASVKFRTSPYRDDTELDAARKKAAAFFASLDRQPLYNKYSVRELITNYRQFLSDIVDNGIASQKDLLSFIEGEDRLFRTFLTHLDECSELGVADITRMTEQVSSMIYKAASEKKIATKDAMVFMAMRTDRRLLLNAQLCTDLIKKGKMNTPNHANAYLWMVLQPYLSIDSFAITMLTDGQKRQMADIAESYPELVSILGSKGYCRQELIAEIPTQLMRLYISTL